MFLVILSLATSITLLGIVAAMICCVDAMKSEVG